MTADATGRQTKRTQTLRSRAALHEWRQRAWRHPGNKKRLIGTVRMWMSSHVGDLHVVGVFPGQVSHDETTSMYFKVAGRKLCVTHNRPKVFRLWWADRAGVCGVTVPPIHEYAGQPPPLPPITAEFKRQKG